MAGAVERPLSAGGTPVAQARAEGLARKLEGGVWIARLLRGGALASGALLVASLVAGSELFRTSGQTAVPAQLLGEGAVALLLATPIARLLGAAFLLARQREWRYALTAAAVLSLLAASLGVG